MREPLLKVVFFNTCMKCFGKKDEINEIKNCCEKVLWVCACLSSFKKNPLLVGAPSYKVNSRVAYRSQGFDDRRDC